VVWVSTGPGWDDIFLAPFSLGIRGLAGLWKARNSSLFDPAGNADYRMAEAREQSAAHSQWAAISLVTITNGGDNLGVYIPMFTHALPWVPAYMAIFALMTGLWCFVSHRLVHHQILGARIRQDGRIALPFVLLGLGLKILSGVRALF
jgi:cadmium resistance protein CadD (predicted permease)